MTTTPTSDEDAFTAESLSLIPLCDPVEREALRIAIAKALTAARDEQREAERARITEALRREQSFIPTATALRIVNE